MNIAICEDNKKDREVLAAFCARYAKEHSVLLTLTQFDDTQALLSDSQVMDMTALLLDIKMENAPSGIDAARILRKMGYRGVLLFITVSKDFYAEGFEVGAQHYLIKPLSYEDFTIAMNRTAQVVGDFERYITVMSNRRQMKIPLRQILYAAVEKHKTILHTTAGVVPVNISLYEASKFLSSPPFLKCCRGCIVNMDMIIRVEEHDFLLKDGSKTPITKRTRTQIKEQYMQHIFSMNAK